MGKDIIVCWRNVERYYGDKPELVERYRKIREGGECPFCPEGLETGGYTKIFESGSWTAVLNQYPYQNAHAHVLIVPRRHIISPTELTRDEMGSWADIVALLSAKYLAFNGFGLALRVGEVGGVTLLHLHWHFIVPKITESGQIPVNFPIG